MFFPIYVYAISTYPERKKSICFFSIHVYTISTYPERKKKHALEIIQQFLWLPETSQSFLIIRKLL